MGWKFLLYFDLCRSADAKYELDKDELERTLARGFRYLWFQGAFDAVGDPQSRENLFKDGWFPFVELLPDDFQRLLDAYEARKNAERIIEGIVSSFDDKRMKQMTSRWWQRSVLSAKKDILQEGIDTYLAANYISSIKVLITEIEGILRQASIEVYSKDVTRTREIAETAGKLGQDKTGCSDSVLMPEAFSDYLREVLYKGFELASGKIDASRHSAGHGVLKAEDYTQIWALQVILSIDQISFSMR